MQNKKKNDNATWLIALAIAVVAGLLAPAVPAAGPRLSANVNESFEIDGEVFESGRLSVQMVREFSPVATLNEIRVDGRSLGIMLARQQPSATLSTRNELIFERNYDGRLVLASIALQGEPVRNLHRQDVTAQDSLSRVATTPRPSRLTSTR